KRLAGPRDCRAGASGVVGVLLPGDVGHGLHDADAFLKALVPAMLQDDSVKCSLFHLFSPITPVLAKLPSSTPDDSPPPSASERPWRHRCSPVSWRWTRGPGVPARIGCPRPRSACGSRRCASVGAARP